ncbi:unnamed protein product [Angiostrongylus costaricensis]|uniref:Synaptosomal-associated protein n=1 Tax=Angiostrongylus costaricensis TaxID=334426 RepID=A0A158PKK0_ANGCS|nr:unnamed protein product [Angiostrongylus costaricensis]
MARRAGRATPALDGAVRVNGIMLPDDMSNELKTLNVKIEDTSYESKEAGIKTLVMLDDQGGQYKYEAIFSILMWIVGKQLERCEGALDTINTDMKEAEEHLKGMEKCCGLCVLPWNKADDFEKNSEYAKAWKKDDDGGVISDQPRITVGDSSMGPQGGYVTRWSGKYYAQIRGLAMGQRLAPSLAIAFMSKVEAPVTDLGPLLYCRITNDAREDEMDENIQQVSTMVGNLRNMAIDMSTEVSNQNRQLDRIHDKAQSNEVRVESANKRANKLLTK